MTLMDESTAAGIEPFCPLSMSPETPALTADGAYTDDVLRIVRGTPNADELAALVAALLLTRRAHHTSDGGHHRPGRPREGYTAPAAWTAGP